MSDLVTLDTVPDAVIANIIQGVLAAEGIEAFIHGEQAAALQLPIACGLVGVKLRVRSKDLVRAQEILADFEE